MNVMESAVSLLCSYVMEGLSLRAARCSKETEQGGYHSACRNGVIARRDGPLRALGWATDDGTPWQAANVLQDYEVSCGPFNRVTKPEWYPPCYDMLFPRSVR